MEKAIEDLKQLACETFRQRFGGKLKLEDADVNALYELLDENEMEDCEYYVNNFFKLDDQWLRDKGFLIRFILSRLNAIATTFPRRRKPTVEECYKGDPAGLKAHVQAERWKRIHRRYDKLTLEQKQQYNVRREKKIRNMSDKEYAKYFEEVFL